MNYSISIYYVILIAIMNIISAEEDPSEWGVIPGVRKTDCPCGHLNKNQPRIVGGDEAGINEFPFMAGIRTLHSPFVFCGGAIISLFHIITAAHCTHSRRYEQLAVIVGDHNIKDTKDTKYSVVHNVKKIIQHEKYDSKGEMENDLALLVTEKIAFSSFVEPVCFPKVKLNLERQRVKVLGWGKKTRNGPYSEVLHKVNLQVVSLETCDIYFKGTDTRNPSQICTLTPHADSCQGDSGGPVIWRDPETNRYVLVGVISFGDLCGKENAPGVNTNIHFHSEWIHHKMAETRPRGKTCSKV